MLMPKRTCDVKDNTEKRISNNNKRWHRCPNLGGRNKNFSHTRLTVAHGVQIQNQSHTSPNLDQTNYTSILPQINSSNPTIRMMMMNSGWSTEL